MRAKLFRAVPFARAGIQKYLARELGVPGEDVIEVMRPPAEVRRSAGTFEGVPITMDHPPCMVAADTLDRYAVGMVSAVRYDSRTDQLRGDLLVWDPVAIHSIASGRRELSGGYEAEYDEDGPGFRQRDIKGNHLAIVPLGRSGSAQRIGG
ncbi:MAG: DUF2213 domain-containing protein [Alcanivoracaceae bacterium]|nr:DUF2213 domain-containing protein [Alcanivoracaceae bacterium]